MTLPAFPKPSSPRLGLRTSLRYELVDGAYRRYSDGREVCLGNAAGKAEYKRRTVAMAERQRWLCKLCGRRMTLDTVSFDHGRPRGIGGGFRDDDIEALMVNGGFINFASHILCNGQRGSRRL